MNILYLCGLNGDSEDHIKKLQSIGDVKYLHLDYSLPPNELENQIWIFILKNHEIDLIVGMHLGGLWSAYIGSSLGVPFVALNPDIHSRETLENGENPDFPVDGCGLIFLGNSDKIFDNFTTYTKYDSIFNVVLYPDKNHQFKLCEHSLDRIKKFYNQSMFI